jgi:hypothetical protein
MSEQKHHLLPLFQESEVLFGHDGTTGLIACESAGNDREEEIQETELAIQEAD